MASGERAKCEIGEALYFILPALPPSLLASLSYNERGAGYERRAYGMKA